MNGLAAVGYTVGVSGDFFPVPFDFLTHLIGGADEPGHLAFDPAQQFLGSGIVGFRR